MGKDFRIVTGCCLAMIAALMVVGAVSHGVLRHIVQTSPLWITIVLGIRRSASTKWAALPCSVLAATDDSTLVVPAGLGAVPLRDIFAGRIANDSGRRVGDDGRNRQDGWNEQLCSRMVSDSNSTVGHGVSTGRLSIEFPAPNCASLTRNPRDGS